MARDRSAARSKARTASSKGTISVSSGATSIAPDAMKSTAQANSRSKRKVPRSWISLATMVLIGMWHGLTINFVIWGAWHGLGLFVHNRWADFTRPRAALLDSRPRLKRLAHIAGVVVTFHFVVLGWVWFALPTPALALAVFGRLFGVGGLR